MEKKTIQDILSSPFTLTDWQNLLTTVFGVKNFFQTPSEIPLPNYNKAESAYELGSFNTADDRIIGLYLVKLKPEVWLERNKVGLRELLRSVYKYDVDGALVVFEQGDKWRLSFVSEIRTLDNEGNIVEQKTEPKRYTYLLGKGEKTNTPTRRLSEVAGKKLYLEDIRKAFSVEALNKEFYKIVATHFYQLVGATTGTGRNAFTYERVLQLPSVNAQEKKIYQEFAVRLIGRTVFCWFLKMKKPKIGESLLPEHLLSSKAVKENNNYYHSILEKLFFQTLNTPMDKRVENLPAGCEQIPFLNGGLFEPQIEDYYLPNKITGFSDHINTLKIPDDWFFNFFIELEKYNFTIDENSVVDIEVSVDPEMLGRIFENLLAEIDPDSGESARNATGSFYTPREIVDYMAIESLVNHIFTQLQSKNETLNIEQDDLKILFRLDDAIDENSPIVKYKTDILNALDNLKILDPACGSGAFPMGVLQKIVMALQKLDPNAEWWKNKQVEKIENTVLRKLVKQKLEQTTVEYARKIGIIQNSLYGVDIQPIASEISKLRCFLTLVVDENIDDTKPNRGVEPLPNLEFKFVTANALLQLPKEADYGGLFNSNDSLNELHKIRLEYLQSYGEEKSELKERFKQIQDDIYKQQLNHLSGKVNLNSRAYKIGTWNPFSHDRTDWFDAEWMFGLSQENDQLNSAGFFDIVIGNPPYIKEGRVSKTLFEQYKKSTYYQGKMDLWYMFACKGIDFLKTSGLLCFIATNNWVTSSGASKLRNKVISDTRIKQLADFGNFMIFESASIQTMIMLFSKNDTTDNYNFDYRKLAGDTILADTLDLLNKNTNNKATYLFPKIVRNDLKDKFLTFSSSDTFLDKIAEKGIYLTEKEVANGIHPHFDFVNKKNAELHNLKIGEGIFGLSDSEKNDLYLSESELTLIKPYYTTEQIHRYYSNPENKLWLIYTDSSFKNPRSMDNYPNLKRHLDRFANVITSDNKPYGLHRTREERFFNGEKIIVQRKCVGKPSFSYSDFDCYVSATFYAIKTNRFNHKYLVGLLNSKLIEFWLKNKGKIQGNNYQIDKEPLLQIPIFNATVEQQQPVIALVNQILSAKKENPQADTSALEKEIDRLVYDLYGLTKEEIKIIED